MKRTFTLLFSAILLLASSAASCWAAVADPTFSPDGGTFSAATTVTITSATASSYILYTDDGTDPATSSTAIRIATGGTVVLLESAALRATGIKTGEANSTTMTSVAYSITLPQCAAVTFSPIAGSFSASTLSVTLASATAGSTIRYTLDGSFPSPINGTLYTTGSPIVIGRTTTVSAIVSKASSRDSTLSSATFTLPTANTWTDTVDTGITTQKQQYLNFVIDCCSYTAGAINTSTHQQVVTYRAVDNATTVAVATLTYENNNRTVRLRTWSYVSLPGALTGPVRDESVIDATTGNSLTWGKAKMVLLAVKTGKAVRSSGSISYYKQDATTVAAVSTVATGSGGASTRVITIN